jgi:hypothetical protein
MLKEGATLLKSYTSDCGDTQAAATYARDVDEIRADFDVPPLPKSGFDFTAWDRFVELGTILSREENPSAAQWSAFFHAPASRMTERPVTVRALKLAFVPALAHERDSLATRSADGAQATYLKRVFDRRAEVQRWRDTIQLQAIANRAKKRALAYLPAGFRTDDLLVAFGAFTADGYSIGDDGVVLDLAYASTTDLEGFLAHEFHHSYSGRVSRTRREFGNAWDVLHNPLTSLRNEGVADLIDKPYPFNGVSPSYAKEYNEAYAQTPQTLRSLDSLLLIAANDTTQVRRIGQVAVNLMPFNSHPNGAYMARTVLETFGVDSVMQAVYNGYSLLRTYAAAEKKRGNPPPFSPKSLALLAELERRHLHEPGK